MFFVRCYTNVYVSSICSKIIREKYWPLKKIFQFINLLKPFCLQWAILTSLPDVPLDRPSTLSCKFVAFYWQCTPYWCNWNNKWKRALQNVSKKKHYWINSMKRKYRWIFFTLSFFVSSLRLKTGFPVHDYELHVKQNAIRLVTLICRRRAHDCMFCNLYFHKKVVFLLPM